MSVLARNITQCEQYKEDTFGKGELPQDAFIPKCDENGAFNPVQCNGFINECWCVDAHGRYIEGTVSKEGEPQCPKSEFACFTSRYRGCVIIILCCLEFLWENLKEYADLKW